MWERAVKLIGERIKLWEIIGYVSLAYRASIPMNGKGASLMPLK